MEFGLLAGGGCEEGGRVGQWMDAPDRVFQPPPQPEER
jgi:hypothetical protein